MIHNVILLFFDSLHSVTKSVADDNTYYESNRRYCNSISYQRTRIAGY
jgi:hypothetical protein